MRLTDIAGEIITEHFDIESGLKKVAVFSDDNDPELRLVEINTCGAVCLCSGQTDANSDNYCRCYAWEMGSRL